MEKNSEAKLDIDPKVIVNKDSKQETTALDKKYGISLFNEQDNEYRLYHYDSITDKIYENKYDYQLDIAADQFASLYTSPETYSIETNTVIGDYTSLIYLGLIIELAIVGYFTYKIVKVRSKLWRK